MIERVCSRRYRVLTLLLAVAGAFWTYNTLPFIAEDCYFYVVIARNLATRGVQSYWGTEPTNGFHPLWLYLLGAYTWGVSRVSTDALHRAAYAIPLSLTLVALGAANWMFVADKARLPRAVLVFPQVVYLSIFGLLYSEAHALFCALSFLARFVCAEEEDGRARPIQIGLAAAAVFLSRLDSLFLVGAFGLWYLVVRRPSPKQVALMATVFAVPAIGYVVSNAVFFGSFTPVSGFLKSSFPTPYVRGLVMYAWKPVVSWSGYSVPFGWLPLFFGAATAVLKRNRLHGVQTLLYPILIGTAFHAVYTAFFTAGFTDWYWYYVLPMLLLSWSAACWLADGWNPRLDRGAQWAALALLVVALFAARVKTPTEQQLPALTTLRVVRALGIDGSVILVSEWPGTLAFYSHNEIIAADMLTSNLGLVKRMVGSPNAAAVLFEEARQKGTPIDYVLYNGGIFFRPSKNFEELDYMDPRMIANVKGAVIGRLQLGPPIFNQDGIVVWKIEAPRDAATQQ
jgi:hypothetical protein